MATTPEPTFPAIPVPVPVGVSEPSVSTGDTITTSEGAPKVVLAPEIVESYTRQVSTMMIEGNGGKFALCLNPENSEYGNILFMHEGLNDWVKQRKATPDEFAAADKVLATMKESIKDSL